MRLVKHTSQYEQWKLMKESRSVLIWLVLSHSLGTQIEMKGKETVQHQRSLSSSIPSLSFSSSSSPLSFPSSSLPFLPPPHFLSPSWWPWHEPGHDTFHGMMNWNLWNHSQICSSTKRSEEHIFSFFSQRDEGQLLLVVHSSTFQNSF